MAFYPCTADRLDSLLNDTMTEVYSEVSVLRNNAFSGASALKKADLPNIQTLTSNSLRDCTNLEEVNLSEVSIINSNAFYADSKLPLLDLPKLTLVNGVNAFFSCTKLATFIFRNNAVVSMSDLNTWNYTPFGTSKAGGKIYVPQSLVSAYEADAYWSQVIALNPLNQLLAIEGSPYEI